MDKQVFKRWSIERPATCMHKTRRLVPNLNRSFLIKIFSQIWETFHFSRLKVDIVMIAIVVQNLKGPRFLDLLKWMILTLLWFVCNLLGDVEDSGDYMGLHMVEMGHQLRTVCVFSDKKWVVFVFLELWNPPYAVNWSPNELNAILYPGLFVIFCSGSQKKHRKVLGTCARLRKSRYISSCSLTSNPR